MKNSWSYNSKVKKIILVVCLCFSFALLAGCIVNTFDIDFSIEKNTNNSNNSSGDNNNSSLDETNATDDSTTEDVVNLIVFEIDGTPYIAEENMRWYRWIVSDYNTDGYGVLDTGEIIYKDLTTYVVSESGVAVNFNDYIVSDGSYSTVTTESEETETITFKIDDTEYTAESGMTWSEFISSSYNEELGFILYDVYVVIDVGASLYNVLGNPGATTGSGYVEASDVIVSGREYVMVKDVDFGYTPATASISTN